MKPELVEFLTPNSTLLQQELLECSFPYGVSAGSPFPP